MKKWIALFLSLILLLGSCVSALAAGNVTIWYSMPENGYMSSYLRNAVLVGHQVFCFLEGTEEKLIVYDLDSETSAEYDLSELFNHGEIADEMTFDLDEGEDDADSEDEPEMSGEESYESEEVSLWFVWQNQLYAILTRHTNHPDGSQNTEGGILRRLSLESGSPVLEEQDLPSLDWSDLMEDSGDWSYSRYIRTAFCMDDTLFLLSYDDSGSDILCLISLKDGSCETRFLQSISALAPGPDGQLLTSQYNWNGSDAEFILSLYDPDSESTQKIASRNIEDTSVQNLYYRADNDTLYYTSAGEIWAAPGMDLNQAFPVNDCPVSGDNGIVQMTDDGFLLLFDSQSVVLRDTDPTHRKEISLTVLDSTYLSSLDSSYYEFTAAHGDIAVVIDRNYNPANVLQGMMNQDSTVDIYILDMASSQFNALFRRGYMAELDSSSRLTSLVDTMYPAVAEAVRRDGRLVCLPVSAYGYTLGINMKAFQKLGYTEADLPRTWDDFFRLLDELPSRTEGSGVSPFMEWYTVSDLKMMFFNTILSNYQDYLNTGSEASYAFNTPLLQNVLDRMESVNYSALGIQEQQDDRSGGGFEWGSDTLLFETGVQLTMSSWTDDYVPLLLSFGDEQATGTYHMYVAFINPYSRHINEAISFLEVLSSHTEVAAAYTFSPENNVPIRYPDYEEYVKSLQETLTTAREELAKTEDAEEQANWQETITMMEADLKNAEETYWQISPATIEAFQARAPYLAPMSYDFNNLISSDEDNSFYESLQRFYEGQLTARDLLQILDQKYQMMRLEGD